MGDRIRHVHIKDSVASRSPGVDWGAPALLGAGDADITQVISRLRTQGYDGPFVIEGRYKNNDRQPAREDIDYLRSVLV